MGKSINPPDTFAGGQFDLPLRVANLVRLATSTTYEAERQSAKKKLLDLGYFLDRAGIVWGKDEVPEYAKDDEL